MSWQNYLSIISFGVEANRPSSVTTVDNPTIPRFYFATDTGSVSLWNPSTSAWAAVNGASLPGPIVSAGSTQGSATAIVNRVAAVTTATASSKGVRLPAAATGIEVIVANLGPTFGVKVYPATGDKINAVATNAADTTVLAALKSTRYLALDTTKWVTLRGA